jgi:topoisomerase-4 subunit A
MRDMTQEDYTHLTDIRIKRISKYNKFKADELIEGLEKDIETTKHHLAHLTEYTVAYFEDLLKKYGKGRERRTQIITFDTIQAAQVIANNAKLYVNRTDGFVGMGMKKDELVCDCSDIDEIIVFRRDGKMVVTKISDKTFVGKDIIHIAVWKKGDDRTTYNIAYLDGKDGTSYTKRFHVKAITRDKEYDLTQGNPKSKILYLTANPNGESELISVKLTAGSAAKVKIFDYDFAELGIKGRDAQGNILTKYPVKDIAQKEVGKSTIGAQQVYWDTITGRLNTDARGVLLGAFDTGDYIFVLYKDGTYEMTDSELTNRYATEEMLHIQKLTPEMIVSAVYFEGNKGWTMVKRFRVETTKLKERISFISDHKDSRIMFATVAPNARIKYTMKLNGKKMQGEVTLGDFMEPKGWKAIGNRLSEQKLMGVEEITVSALVKPASQAKVGDTIEFDM